MATKVWRGDAQAVAQVDTATPGGTIEIGDVFILTINSKTVTFSATDTTVATTVTGIVAAVAASGDSEFSEIVATDTITEVTLTAATAGVPFTATATTTEAGGGAADLQTFVLASVTGSAGPNHWDVNENWSDADGVVSVIPAAGDDIFVDDSSVSILYGIDQSALDAYGSLAVAMGFTGEIGLPRINSSGYAEYRPTFLKLAAATVTNTDILIGDGTGTGSSRIQIDAGSSQTTIDMRDSGTSSESDDHPVQFIGTHASNTIAVIAGSLDIARRSGTIATVATLKTSSNGTVRCSDLVTLTTVDVEGNSTIDLASAVTTLSVKGDATLNVTGSGAVTTLNALGGNISYQGSGTITTLSMDPDASIDFDSNLAASMTVTDTAAPNGTTITDSHARVTWTNAITGNARLEDVAWKFGPRRTFKVT